MSTPEFREGEETDEQAEGHEKSLWEEVRAEVCLENRGQVGRMEFGSVSENVSVCMHAQGLKCQKSRR